MSNVKEFKPKIKRVLRSLRTKENQVWVNALLGKIDIMKDDELVNHLTDIKKHCVQNSLDFKEELKNVLQSKIIALQNEGKGENYSLNGAFLFNIKDNSALLHMPLDFTKPFGNKESFLKAMDAYNPYLLDAIDKLKDLKDNGFYPLNGVDTIAMYSPILMGDELVWLKDLGFETNYHKKGNYKNPQYFIDNPEAIIGVTKFQGKSFGTAKLAFPKFAQKNSKIKRNKCKKTI